MATVENGMTYHVCTEYPIHHYDNCNTCFGFGVYSQGNPVIAAEAHGAPWIDTFPCPECGSTVKGVPSNGTNRTAHNA